MKSEHGIMLAGSFDDLAGKVIRIGHMGANATISNMIETLSALDTVLRELNVSLHVSLSEYFLHYVNSNPA